VPKKIFLAEHGDFTSFYLAKRFVCRSVAELRTCYLWVICLGRCSSLTVSQGALLQPLN
jgi:hypothetical protein